MSGIRKTNAGMPEGRGHGGGNYKEHITPQIRKLFRQMAKDWPLPWVETQVEKVFESSEMLANSYYRTNEDEIIALVMERVACAIYTRAGEVRRLKLVAESHKEN